MSSTTLYQFDVDDVALGDTFAVVSQGGRRLLLKNLLPEEVTILHHLIRNRCFERHQLSEKMFSSFDRQGLICFPRAPVHWQLSKVDFRIPSCVVSFLARPLRPLFSPIGIAGMILFFILAFNLPQVHFAKIQDFSHWVMHVGLIDALITIGVIMTGMVIHEFGHATACLRATGATGAIRFLTYRGTPAMAADVSSICLTDERGKATVAIAGALFQCIFGVCVLATGADSLRMGASMAILGAMFSMTPLPNSDGYWVLRDFFNLQLYPRLWIPRSGGNWTDVLYGYGLLGATAGFAFMLFRQCLYLWHTLSTSATLFTLGNVALAVLLAYLLVVSCIFISKNIKLFMLPDNSGL